MCSSVCKDVYVCVCGVHTHTPPFAVRDFPAAFPFNFFCLVTNSNWLFTNLWYSGRIHFISLHSLQMKNISQSIKCIVKASTCEKKNPKKRRKKAGKRTPKKRLVRQGAPSSIAPSSLSSPYLSRNLHRKIVKNFPAFSLFYVQFEAWRSENSTKRKS